MEITVVKGVELLKAGKEGPPAPCKMPTTFEPEVLNLGVVHGPTNALSK